MIGAFLTAILLSTSVSVYIDKNPPKNYGRFQEDYWEQNDINSMDWNHPLREGRFRQEENTKGRYFPKDEKKIVPPIEDNNKDKEKSLIAGID